MPKRLAVVVCPFDQAMMEQQPVAQMMGLLLSERNAVFKMVSGGGNPRGKWFECPSCGYAALFRKDPTEP